ncbi:hypothetical protein AUEXF2481DRAFT_177435 [Aureobasidium subglaciale EXF-2481]|uniref:Uncharacterized protein n=1 Tax=Aureobasidium subglaciale (strain EXF-2481) TaxID=1043005 RepID=A0A074YNT2_AURSE|nr:uncharacterized protein AUEXF2481DRAFT_177435 [Aureobasidium subglaciale EXF-2481]KEQ99463.1 hypothetical protein AUEXF2481DRAFT_177435 [Aureobasidium subglaciale EXF-2481]
MVLFWATILRRSEVLQSRRDETIGCKIQRKLPAESTCQMSNPVLFPLRSVVFFLLASNVVIWPAMCFLPFFFCLFPLQSVAVVTMRNKGTHPIVNKHL